MTGTVIDLRSDDVRARKAATSAGDFEPLAARCVAFSTGAVVYIQDDGSRPSMPDLRLEWSDGRVEYGEVIADMAEEYGNLLATMGVFGGGLPWVIAAEQLVFDWFVSVGPRCKLKTVSRPLIDLLASVERGGFTPSLVGADFTNGALLAAAALDLVEAFAAAKVRDVARVHLLPPAVEASFEPDWDAFSDWLDGVLANPKYADMMRKLVAPAGAGHAVIGATMSSDGEAYHALSRDVKPTVLPRRTPRSPAEVSRLWVMIAQGAGTRVLVWDADGGWCDTRGCGPLAAGARPTI